MEGSDGNSDPPLLSPVPIPFELPVEQIDASHFQCVEDAGHSASDGWMIVVGLAFLSSVIVLGVLTGIVAPRDPMFWLAIVALVGCTAVAIWIARLLKGDPVRYRVLTLLPQEGRLHIEKRDRRGGVLSTTSCKVAEAKLIECGVTVEIVPTGFQWRGAALILEAAGANLVLACVDNEETLRRYWARLPTCTKRIPTAVGEHRRCRGFLRAGAVHRMRPT